MAKPTNAVPTTSEDSKQIPPVARPVVPTKSEKDELDDELTEALEETFPASDPMSSLRSD